MTSSFISHCRSIHLLLLRIAAAPLRSFWGRNCIGAGIVYVLLCIGHTTAIAAPLNEATFRTLTTPTARIAFLKQEFSLPDKSAYLRLLPLIEAKKDYPTTLFWHYRYYALADSFLLTMPEQEKNLQQMYAKATQEEDRVSMLVAKVNLLILQHQQRQINTIQLYRRSLPYFEAMRKMGFDKFVQYDLNAIISYCMADCSGYWSSDIENIRKYLKVAEQYVSTSAKSQHYRNLVFYQLRDCDLQDTDLTGCNDYSWCIYQANHRLNPDMNPADWRTAYWQVVAFSQLAILHNIGKQEIEARQYAQKALAMYKELNIQSYNRDKISIEKYILDDLTIVLIQLDYLHEVPVLLNRFDSILVRLRKYKGGYKGGYEESEWGVLRDREQYYEKLGDFKRALAARRASDYYYDQLYERNSRHELDHVREEYKVEVYVDELEIAHKQRLRQQYITLGVVGLMVLLAAVAYAVYWRIDRDRKVIAAQKAILEDSLIEKETLIKEVHHRVKNNLQIISGLLEKQAMKTTDEMTRKLLKEGQNRVFSMALVHQNLYNSNTLSAIDLQQYFSSLSHNIQQSQQSEQHQIVLTMDIAEVKMNVDSAIPLGLILNELLTNSYKYAFAEKEAGDISVTFQPEANSGYRFIVKDNGSGIPAEVDWRKSRSLGLSLVNGLVRQLAGSFELASAPNEGTLVTMHIP